MDIIIQSLGFKAGDSLENFIREKVQTLKHDNIIRANVTLYKGPDSNPENNYCEIRLEVPGNDPFVKKSGAYFETAISECIDVLNESMGRDKEKNINRRQADGTVIQDALSKGAVQDDAYDEDI
jgi:ribosome-associated translation inhibitor RaiA